MSTIEKLYGEDRVWSALRGALMGTAQSSMGKFININCPLCTQRGETQDKRRRCGIKYDAKGIGVNCFNCGLKTKYAMGSPLSHPMRDFLTAVGVGPQEVMRLGHWAYSLSRIAENADAATKLALSTVIRPGKQSTDFTAVELPAGARPVTEWLAAGCDDPNLLRAAEYLLSRGDEVMAATTYYWTPQNPNPVKGGTNLNLNRRLIIPAIYEDKIVGWTGRAIEDGFGPKYYDQVPKNFLFNSAAMSRPGRKFVIIQEGVFDALALDSVGTMGASMNEKLIAWVKNSGVKPIVLPDRDRAGQRLIDVALTEGWAVSFPRLRDGSGFRNWWHHDVKDGAAAVARYGRLYTLRSVLASATESRMRISMYRKLLT